MNKILKFLMLTVSIFASAFAADAQQVRGVVVAGSESVVKSAPYSAETSTETVQTLVDGNTITRSYGTIVYRDGEGRTRTEQIQPAAQNEGGLFSLREDVTISDPVAGYIYYLNTKAKTARRLESKSKIVTLGALAPSVKTIGEGEVRTVTLTTGRSSKSEELGAREYEGIPCSAHKFTTTIAAGTVGNARELVTSTESCFSRELRITLYSKRTDLQMGNSTFQLKNIKRGEPDKSLFVVPSDYKIITSTVQGFLAPAVRQD